jgi:hypothetical protein
MTCFECLPVQELATQLPRPRTLPVVHAMSPAVTARVFITRQRLYDIHGTYIHGVTSRYSAFQPPSGSACTYIDMAMLPHNCFCFFTPAADHAAFLVRCQSSLVSIFFGPRIALWSARRFVTGPAPSSHRAGRPSPVCWPSVASKPRLGEKGAPTACSHKIALPASLMPRLVHILPRLPDGSPFVACHALHSYSVQ